MKTKKQNKQRLLKTVFALISVLMAGLLAGCSARGKQGETSFGKNKAVINSFEGLGVEWGAYEDTNRLTNDYKEKTEKALTALNPKLVRCMFNFDWIVSNLDKKGTDDLNDDTWSYDFSNRYMTTVYDVLDYCQAHDVKVAFGVWNVIGTVGEDDEWGMIPNSTSDIRWSKMSADLMEYLIKVKGYSCIKWFVNSNEPNYTGAKGSSKNAYNTYDKWEQGVKNLRAAFDKIGLNNLDIVGGDTTGFTGSSEYLPKIAKNLSDVVNNYGVHMYISNYDIDTATYGEHMKQLYDGVRKTDKKLGTSKPMIIWETGLLDGKNVTTDCNSYIANYSYGIRMADLSIQSILSGVSGIAYWDLDDAMHFMYSEAGATAKEWGLFSTLASAQALKQEYRPWFQSTILLTNLLVPGCSVYAPDGEAKENFRALAAVGKDKDFGGIVAVNRGTKAITETFRLSEKIKTDKDEVYVYLFNEQNLRIGSDGLVVPNYKTKGSLNSGITVEVPANCMVVLSTKLLCGDEKVAEKTPSGKTEISAKPGNVKIVAPAADENTSDVPTFKWQAAENAETYTFELCSSENFSQTEDDVYIKKTGIVDTEYNIFASLKTKDCYYYWRVTAVNGKGSVQGETNRFFLAALTGVEIEFPIEYADEWVVHKEGSQAEVSIDSTDFFGNGKNSLKIAFESEKTNQGIPESDGWMVITHQQETEMYGVDAFYFNFYYSGQNARVFLRVMDEDNEYWNAEIMLANNTKQKIIIPFSDFTLRTKSGSIIANQQFDYHYIKYMELVFEETFGDGVAEISDLKAVSFENYSDLFIDKVNFSKLDTANTVFDNYNFGTKISDNGNTFTMDFSGKANELNAKGIQGYGFVKLPINKSLFSGDAFAFDIAYEGSKAANVLIRVIEEDGDRWVYKMNAGTIPEDGHIVVPYAAFTLSEYHGDGSRQFYFLKQLQLGIENTYSAGSVTYSDFEVVTLADVIPDFQKVSVSEDGMIDNFNDYVNSAEMYFKWQLSTSNKDEAMTVDKEFGFTGGGQDVRLGYKADMGPACYGVVLTNSPKGFDSISFKAKDASVKFDDPAFRHINSVSATCIVTAYTNEGAEYAYVIPSLEKDWTKYTIKFSDFELKTEGAEVSEPLSSGNIAGFMLGFMYYYYNADGTPNPQYPSNNYIYFDDFTYAAGGKTETISLSVKLLPSEDDANICLVDDFDSYTDETLFDSWSINSTFDYAALALSNDTANGSGYSLEMRYKGNSDSVSYVHPVLFDESVNAKGIRLSLKGDGKATVYINIYLTYANSTYKYRATLKNVGPEWTEYVVGFNNFEMVEGSGSMTLSKKLVSSITKMTIGIVNSKDYEESTVLLDNFRFDGNIGYAEFSSGKE